MDFWQWVSIGLSLLSTVLLLSTPYLRITSIGWVIAIWAIPFAGALFFLLTVVRGRTQGQQHKYCALDNPCGHGPEASDNLIEKLGIDCEFQSYFRMTDSEVLDDEAFMPAVFAAIDGATKRVWITTYILSGNFRDELIAKLSAADERGVEVLMLVDRVGSGLYMRPERQPFKDIDVPFRVSVFHRSRIRSGIFIEKRLHSKIVIVDEDIGFIGAHNLRDEVNGQGQDDVHNVSLKFSGSVILQLEAVFEDLWFLNTREKIKGLFPSEHHDANEDGAAARIIFSDPIERSHSYNKYLTLLFMAARKRICIWMPYVIPSQSMRNAIIAASKMGLDVRVLFPGKTDSVLVDSTHQLVLRELCDNGVECAMSEGRFDHSKLMIIDDITIVGSTNLDFRSLYRNYEANIEVNDETFTAQILAKFDSRYTAATSVTEVNTHWLLHMRNQLTSLMAALY